MDDAGDLERTYRREATRTRAALAARIGDVGLAEEAVQDAFVEALEHWQEKGEGEAGGMPPNPGGWLATTVWRKAVDRLRRDRTGQEKRCRVPGRARRCPCPAWGAATCSLTGASGQSP